MTPEIEAVLASGATILVKSAATDAWNAARLGFIKLFGRGGPAQEAATERRLDALAATVDQAPPDRRADVADKERAGWLVRLTDLVEDDPTAIGELRSLVELLAPQLPPSPQALFQTNTASGNAQVFGVQGGGTINVHGGPSPSSPTVERPPSPEA